MSDVRYPESNYLSGKSEVQNEEARFVSAVEEYKLLLKNKTHPSNQTQVHEKIVMTTLQRLVISANDLDSVSPGKGIFGMIMLSLRASLSLKDELIKLEAENKALKVDLNRLKKR